MRTAISRSRVMLVGGCLVTLASSACDQRTSIVPNAPTVPQAPAVPTVTLSGTVIERFTERPIQGALVGLSPRTLPANRSWNWHAHLSTSDTAGRFTITGIEADLGSFWVYATTQRDLSQYTQQCATTVTTFGVSMKP